MKINGKAKAKQERALFLRAAKQKQSKFKLLLAKLSALKFT